MKAVLLLIGAASAIQHRHHHVKHHKTYPSVDSHSYITPYVQRDHSWNFDQHDKSNEDEYETNTSAMVAGWKPEADQTMQQLLAAQAAEAAKEAALAKAAEGLAPPALAQRQRHHHHHHNKENVQTGDYFYPFEKGMLGGAAYERVVPAHFEGDGDDIFMRSVIKNYALETKTDDDDKKPTGKFFLDEVQAKALASEVLATHKGLKGNQLKSYLDTYWAKSWGHFDVNKGGAIEAIKAPQLIRFLASDQYFQI